MRLFVEKKGKTKRKEPDLSPILTKYADNYNSLKLLQLSVCVIFKKG